MPFSPQFRRRLVAGQLESLPLLGNGAAPEIALSGSDDRQGRERRIGA
jgi:hypothetical protein